MHQNISWLATMFTWRLGAPLVVFYFIIVFFPICAFLINLRFFFSIWFDQESQELKLSFKPDRSILILAVAGFVIAALFIIHGIGDAAAGQD